MSGMTGAGRSLKASSSPGSVLENVSPYRVGRTGTFRESRSSSASRSPSRRTRCPSAVGLSRPATSARPEPTCALLEERYAARLSERPPRGDRPHLARVQHTDTAEIRFCRPSHRPHDRHPRAREPRQGRRRPGGGDLNLLYGLRETAGLGTRACWSSRVGDRRQGVRRRGVSAGIGRPASRTSPLFARSSRRSGRPCGRRTASSRRPLSLEAPSRGGAAPGRCRQRGRRERGDRRAREEDARVTAADVASAARARAEEALVLSTGVIGPRLR